MFLLHCTLGYVLSFCRRSETEKIQISMLFLCYKSIFLYLQIHDFDFIPKHEPFSLIFIYLTIKFCFRRRKDSSPDFFLSIEKLNFEENLNLRLLS